MLRREKALEEMFLQCWEKVWKVSNVTPRMVEDLLSGRRVSPMKMGGWRLEGLIGEEEGFIFGDPRTSLPGISRC